MINITEKSIHIPDTQISEIDKQYQKIKSIFEQLTQCIQDKDFEGKLSTVFFNLVYIHDHYFMQEQITLSKYNYKDLEEIKQSHHSFLEDVVKYQRKTEEDAEMSCREMVNFISNWSGKYFELNKKAIAFLKEKGTK